MKQIVIVIVLATVISVALSGGCKEPQATSATPQGAFARLKPCIDNNDTTCLFRNLDRDSRWSAHTIHRTLNQMRTLVENSYPADPNLRASTYGAWKKEAQATTVHEMFELFCRKRSCLKNTAVQFGAIKSQTPGTDNGLAVETVRGGRYQLLRWDGKWGLATWSKELEAAKIRLDDNLKQVQKNAAAYEEQRRATGSSN